MNMKVLLHVDQNAKPRFFKPKSVLYILEDMFECEFSRLEKERNN